MDLVLTLPENQYIKLDDAIKSIVDERNFDEMDGEIYQVEKNLNKCLDCEGHSDDKSEDEEFDKDNSDEDIKFDIKTDNGNKKVRITIDDNSQENKVRKQVETIEKQKDGSEKVIREKQIGPIHIREEENVNKKK
jgi:hypothetical protein